MKRRDKLKPCAYCGNSTAKLGEHFYLKPEVWFKIYPHERGFVCIECCEKKLGRTLNAADFTDCTINKPQRGVEMSQRLINRLTNVATS